MAAIATNEKAVEPIVVVHPTTAHLLDKPSCETLSSDVHEKALPRPSDVSTLSHNRQANPFDTDIEAMITSSSQQCITKSTTTCTRGRRPECTVWPGQNHWREKAKAAKRARRSCNCLAGFSKRNRIIIKILIGLLIVGIAVGVGLGISKPLGAGIWQPHNQ